MWVSYFPLTTTTRARGRQRVNHGADYRSGNIVVADVLAGSGGPGDHLAMATLVSPTPPPQPCILPADCRRSSRPGYWTLVLISRAPDHSDLASSANRRFGNASHV